MTHPTIQLWRKGATDYEISTDGLRLLLRRYPCKDLAAPSVLCLHGASASSDTFLLPHGGLVHYLREGWDVWTLDWRGSCQIVDPLVDNHPPLKESVGTERAFFSADRVAQEDIPRALKRIREEIGQHRPLSIVAHCFGAGVLSIAVSLGKLEPFNVSNIVLTTLGLFYRVPWDGWIRGEDFIIERIVANAPDHRAISPHTPEKWPADLKKAYDHWPRSWLPNGSNPDEEFFRRLSFMFGQPYLRERLAAELSAAVLKELFGGMHLGLYLQAGQFVRRGYAAPLDSLDVFDQPNTPRDLRYLVPDHFADKRVTLITGAENRLWHRNSIDIMYEWLLSDARVQAGAGCAKHVLRDYAHQDLLWGAKSQQDVYPLIAQGLDSRRMSVSTHANSQRELTLSLR